ncbi:MULTISPECIES: UDP-2,3-diacylglucosamine diphosphatase [Mesorhizobium]|uniref:UDP-2,3-diacylglucosamine diphosphatase n=1 Tax=Mesorhizobium denitrificans TaxID=2294114 RepID=A0A371X9J8_9HYPH|nr:MULTISPECIES: UDP-2,3-diacylglucosamine diphosphatase [Mesorhizobium]RFC65704.1 UDP-2,3-diacylglucosamine diphosphatase [Mesorhizobium denitrificans]
MDAQCFTDSSEAGQATRYRSLFISDVHLGTKGAQAEALLEFLKMHDADTIYLVGDIIDGWRLRASWYWPQTHNDVVQKLLRKVRKGTRIIYIPGNHDEFLREFCGLQFGGIEINETAIHEAADGKRYLIVHGDLFDLVVRHAKWLALLGDWAYRAAMVLSAYINFVRRKLGFTYWSLSAWAKARVKNAVNFIGQFEDTLAAEAKRHEVDGVICGHIHSAAMRDIGGLDYINTGDWVESCTAVVEHWDGRMEMVNWQTQSQVLSGSAQLALPLRWRRAA